MIVDRAYLYEHLICEFNHYDVCLSGLLNVEGRWFVAKIVSFPFSTNEPVTYRIVEIEMDQRCLEYLKDYRSAYPHWFHDETRGPYRGWSLKWFGEKWSVNPIEEKSGLWS